DKRAEQRVDDAALAAHEAGTADDDRGDDVEFGGDADLGRADAGAARGDDAGHGGENAGNHVNSEDVAADGDAREPHRLLVGADGGDHPAEAGEVEDDAADDEDGEHEDDRLRNAEQEARAELRKHLPALTERN